MNYRTEHDLLGDYPVPSKVYYGVHTALDEHMTRSVGIVTALNPFIGYENASSVAKEANSTNKSVTEIVLERGLLSKEKLDEILKPDVLTKPRWIKR